MHMPKTIVTSLSIALLCISSATIAQADTITFTGSRDFSGGRTGVPNPAGAAPRPPPFFLVTLPPGVGASNLGSFTSTESHCLNSATGNLSNGLFTYRHPAAPAQLPLGRIDAEIAEFINESGLMGHVAFRKFQKLSEHSNYFTGGLEEYRCPGDEGNESCRDEGASVYLILKATVGTCIVGSR